MLRLPRGNLRTVMSKGSAKFGNYALMQEKKNKRPESIQNQLSYCRTTKNVLKDCELIKQTETQVKQLSDITKES